MKKKIENIEKQIEKHSKAFSGKPIYCVVKVESKKGKVNKEIVRVDLADLHNQTIKDVFVEDDSEELVIESEIQPEKIKHNYIG
tara:strand:- start:388 stop:639 length:252 start_codon:yes stop_codon:yes gene_type:complete